MTDTSNHKLIDGWFPCAAVDGAVGTAAGSGQHEKAIFTWFASRPVAQARAAVLTALLPDTPEIRLLIKTAIATNDPGALGELRNLVAQRYPKGRPVVVDVFSGRAIIPLEASRAGAHAIGIDLSPVATLAGLLLADYPTRDWSREPNIPFSAETRRTNSGEDDEEQLVLADPSAGAPRLVADVRRVLNEVGRRMLDAVAPLYPRNADGSIPWGYLWTVTIPCDGCGKRFPLVGSLALRHPYRRTDDPGQSFSILVEDGHWSVEVQEGLPNQLPTFRSPAGKKGKSAHCPFCRHVHSLDAVKAKGIAQNYEDVLLVVADTPTGTKKVFRRPRPEEVAAATRTESSLTSRIGPFSAVPDELIPAGNEDTVRASGYGFRTYGSLMGLRQAAQFAETARAIRSCRDDMLSAGVSRSYADALSSYAAAVLVRRLRRATRGARLESRGGVSGEEQNRVYVGDVFADESKITFNFDFLETGPGVGAGSWESVAVSELAGLAEVVTAAPERPARLLQGSALALPMRDGTVDAVITDPPYYNMIDYSDASDLFHVWLKRVLFDVHPDLFGDPGLQDKTEEVIVKRGNAVGEHRTKSFYEASLARAFAESRRVLRVDGHLVVVFGHADPDAWQRLLSALHQAGFVVTSSWPSRTESANTGVASIKVTVTIGCRVAPAARPVTTATQVDREVADVVRARVKDWVRDGLALSDQMMAAYGPAMEVFGRYSSVITPDAQPVPLERYLTVARKSVRDAMALKLEEIPLETFDLVTAFAVFWMHAFGRAAVPKGEAKFTAQSSNLRIEDIRALVLTEASGGYRLELGDPGDIDTSSPVFNVVRAMAAAWQREGSEGVSSTFVKAERAADDQHVWAVVGDLAAQLPSSDAVARALAAIQRNRSTIQTLARGISERRASGDNQLHLTDV